MKDYVVVGDIISWFDGRKAIEIVVTDVQFLVTGVHDIGIFNRTCLYTADVKLVMRS